MLQLLAALPDRESRALAPKEVVRQGPDGIPVTTPVEAVRLKPGGSDPVIENV